jgi:ribosomal protein S27AE
METLEEITPLQVKEMTREQARTMIEERTLMIQRLENEIDLLTPKACPPKKPAPIIDADKEQKKAVKACPECGSTDIMPQKGNRVFCRQCNVSSEVP